MGFEEDDISAAELGTMFKNTENLTKLTLRMLFSGLMLTVQIQVLKC
jgi:hypothetical protein